MEKELRTLTVDTEFRDLIPPLTNEERELLEDSILKEGCETPLAVWNGVIVDGHNRYEICQKNGVPFAVMEKDSKEREEALLWIVTNQLGRRNLSPYQRGKLVMRFEPVLRAQAQSRRGKRTDLGDMVQNSAPCLSIGGKTRAKLAELAGVSHDTIKKVKKLMEAADEETKQKLDRGAITINKAYNEVMLRERTGKEKPDDRIGEEKPSRETEVPTTDAAQQATQATVVPPISSIGMHKGHPIHVGAPLPDRPEMFSYLENHMCLIADNFLAGAANAMRLYTPGMTSPENTRRLREILKSACGAIRAFDQYVKEMIDHE
jgi:ParB-like chromosome segregation protein Spo0J